MFFDLSTLNCNIVNRLSSFSLHHVIPCIICQVGPWLPDWNITQTVISNSKNA